MDEPARASAAGLAELAQVALDASIARTNRYFCRQGDWPSGPWVDIELDVGTETQRYACDYLVGLSFDVKDGSDEYRAD